MQVCGAHIDSMTRCAELINNEASVDFIDINIGCPIDLVFKKVCVFLSACVYTCKQYLFTIIVCY